MVREAEEIQEINMQDVEAEIEQLRADIEAFYLEHPQNDPLLPDKIWVKDMNELEEKITEHIPKKVVEDEIIIKNTIEKEGGINPEGSNPLDFSRMREFDLPEEFLNEVFLPDEVEREDGRPDEKIGKELVKKSADEQDLSLFTDVFQQAEESNESGAVPARAQEAGAGEISSDEISDIMANDLIRESFGEGLLNDLGTMNEELKNRIYSGEGHVDNGNGEGGAVQSQESKGAESAAANKTITKENTQDLLRDMLQHGELQAEIVNAEDAAAEMGADNEEDSANGDGNINEMQDPDCEGERSIEDLLNNITEGGQASEAAGGSGLHSEEIDKSKVNQEEMHTEEDPVNKIFISQKRREKTEGDSEKLNTEQVDTADEQMQHKKSAPKVKQKEKVTIQPIIKEVYAEEILEEKIPGIDDKQNSDIEEKQEEIERILQKTVEKTVEVKKEDAIVQRTVSKDEGGKSIEDLLRSTGAEGQTEEDENDDLLHQVSAKLDSNSEIREEKSSVSIDKLHGELTRETDQPEGPVRVMGETPSEGKAAEIERILQKTVKKTVEVKTEDAILQRTVSKDEEGGESIEDLLRSTGAEGQTEEDENDDLLHQVSAKLDSNSEIREEKSSVSIDKLHGELARETDQPEGPVRVMGETPAEGNAAEDIKVQKSMQSDTEGQTDQENDDLLRQISVKLDGNSEIRDEKSDVSINELHGEHTPATTAEGNEAEERTDTSLSDTEELLRQILDEDSDVSSGEEIQEKQVFAEELAEGHLHAEPESVSVGSKDEDLLKFVEDSIAQTVKADAAAAESKGQAAIKTRRNEAEKMLGRKQKKAEQKKKAAQALKDEQEAKSAKKEIAQINNIAKSTSMALYEKPQKSLLERLLNKLRSLFKKKVPQDIETVKVTPPDKASVKAKEQRQEEQSPIVEAAQVVENEMQIFGVVNGAISGETIIINEHAVIKNNIEAKERVLCMKNATVMGGIKAKEVIVEGIVRGRINAEREIIVRNSGLVVGDIRARQVSIAPEAIVDGDVILNS